MKVPTEKLMTKWERFAKDKGIKKQKRSRKIWDEKTQSYKYRWGKDSLAKSNEDWVYDHNPEKLGGYEDPFIQMREEKRLAKEKQKKAEIRNRRTSVIDRTKTEMGGANPSSLVIGSISSTANASKERIKRSIRLAQRSTRSLGVFDEKRADEPKPKKRKVMATSSAHEKEFTKKVVNKVIKDIDRKGEFDDAKLVNNEIRSQQLSKKSSAQNNKSSAQNKKGPVQNKKRKLK